MSAHIDAADCAKMVREDLKRAFPGVKFSVRTDKYAGGASIRVRWTNGPTRAAVERIAKRREGADFDGMQDLKTYRRNVVSEPDGTVREVHYGSDYVFCDRDYSPEWEARAWEWVRTTFGADRVDLIPPDWRGTILHRVCWHLDASGNVAAPEGFTPFDPYEWDRWFGGAR